MCLESDLEQKGRKGRKGDGRPPKENQKLARSKKQNEEYPPQMRTQMSTNQEERESDKKYRARSNACGGWDPEYRKKEKERGVDEQACWSVHCNPRILIE